MQDVRTTMMFVLYAYFYSMVEDDPQGVNGFRVWRASWPEEEKAIAAVEALVTPLVPGLKLFRNRLGFHGSRSRSHEAKAFDLFAQHSGTAVWNAMANFKSLGAALFKTDLDRQRGLRFQRTSYSVSPLVLAREREQGGLRTRSGFQGRDHILIELIGQPREELNVVLFSTLLLLH
jgi:hypothetical protein